MRITDIKITNYRAFYGEHHIQLDKDGKNLMLYGENGSGKSSLFTAIKDFFSSSLKPLDDVEENIFTPNSQKGSASIKINVRESPLSTKSIEFELNAKQKEIVSSDKILIADASKIRGFFDYRSLLKTHLQYQKTVNLFELLLTDILYHSINRFSGKEIGWEWEKLYNNIFEVKQTIKVRDSNIDYLKTKFNPGLKELLASIEKDVNVFLGYFGKEMKVKLEFPGITYFRRKTISGNHIGLKIDFYSKHIPRHHFFLNEARLSALAVSIYLASIKVNPTKGALKLLVLDDLLIGLDMSNRLPLLDILKNHFVEVKADDRFQIIMTTYDKVWYELVKSYFGEEQWKFVEVYSKRLNDDDFEIPIIKHDNGYLDRAKHYLTEKDFKASAVYIRTEFERLVKTICDKQRIPVAYKKNQKEVTSDDFWTAIESQTNLDPALVKEIKIHRGVVMNPFSHYDLEKPEFEKELKDTIASVEKLKAVDIKALKKTTFDQLSKEIDELKKKLTEKDNVVQTLNAKLKAK